MPNLTRVDNINDYLHKDERSLLHDTAAGSAEAYTILYRRYLQRIMNYILVFTNHDKSKADDIVQDVFISVWETRENLITVRSFEAYLKRSAKNRLLNVLKHDEYLRKLHMKMEVVAAGNETEHAFDFKAYFTVAEETVNALPYKRKLVFLLSTKEGLSLSQIADLLKISKSRVKQQLYQAVAQVRDRIRQQ